MSYCGRASERAHSCSTADYSNPFSSDISRRQQVARENKLKMEVISEENKNLRQELEQATRSNDNDKRVREKKEMSHGATKTKLEAVVKVRRALSTNRRAQSSMTTSAAPSLFCGSAAVASQSAALLQ